MFPNFLPVFGASAIATPTPTPTRDNKEGVKFLKIESNIHQAPKPEPEPSTSNGNEGRGPLPLLIPEILDMVLKEFESWDLVNSCRFVCRRWNSAALGILQSRDDIYIHIPTAQKFQEFESQSNPNKSSGSHLTSNLLKFQNFQFDSQLLSNLKFQSFFSPFNSKRISTSNSNVTVNIKRIILTNLLVDFDGSHNEYMRGFYWFLFHQIPHVEYMEIQCGPSAWSPRSTTDFSDCWDPEIRGGHCSEGQVQLSKLKVLKFFIPSHLRLHFSGFVTGLIDAAGNLEELNVPLSLSLDADLISSLVHSGRSHIVKEIKFNFHYPGNTTLIVMENFACSEPQVRVIHEMAFRFVHGAETHRHSWDRLENYITKIVKSSANTLESITMDPIGLLEEFQILHLPRLSTLSINIDKYDRIVNNDEYEPLTDRLYPLHIPMPMSIVQDRAAGSLKEVKISWERYIERNHSWLAIFGSDFKIKSVTHLTLSCVSRNWLPKISECFPNVTHLRFESLHDSDNLQKFLRQLFLFFPNLKKIKMVNIFDRRVMHWDYIDSCFTGIPEHKCRELLQEFEEPEIYDDAVFGIMSKIRKVEILYLHLSLLDMKHLTSLSITFNPSRDMHFYCTEGRLDIRKLKLFSPVSQVYAFNLVPKMKVTVKVGVE